MEMTSGVDALAPLVARAVQGDRGAADDLVRDLRPRVFRYVLARLLDPHAAEDVTQEAMMTMVSSLPRYVDQGRSVTAWVFGIAANKVSESRRSAARRRDQLVDTVPEQPGDPMMEPQQAAVRLDTARRVAALLETLPAQHAEILRLRVAAGLSAEETATVLGMTPGAVRVAQHRALAKLRATAALDVLS